MFESLLVIIVLSGSLLLGGWLTSSILGLRRIGYGTALFLGMWYLISLTYAMPMGWQAWVGELALILELILLAAIYFSPRKKHKAFGKHPYQRIDILGYLLILITLSIPALVLPVPLDTDAQGFGYLALMARLHGDLTNLAPFNPDLDYLYAPGFSTINAYLSERLGVPMHRSQISVGAVIASLIIMVLYDFGLDLKNRKLARCHAMAAVIGTGLFTAYMDSHYTSVLGLFFGATFLAMVYRLIICQRITPVFIQAAIALGALVLAHPDTTITIALGYGAWLLLMPLARPRISFKRWCMLTFALPTFSFVLITPWFLCVVPLLGSEIGSPFVIKDHHWKMILAIPPHVMYHGVTVLLATLGLVFTLKKRRHQTLLALGWLIMIIEFAALGILEKIAPAIMAPLIKYHYPFSIAWHGPIIPYTLLTGGLLYIIYRRLPANLEQRITRLAPAGLIAAMMLVITAGIFNYDILQFTKGKLSFFGAFSSHDDVKAMTWLRENTPSDTVILNFPGPIEADWVPVISERRSIYFRPQYFFSNHHAKTEAQIDLKAFWKNPVDENHLPILQKYNVEYVIVPQVIGRPDSFKEHYRWQRPFSDKLKIESKVADASYLDLVLDLNGARIYKVIYQSE